MGPELHQFVDPLNPRGWVAEPTRRRLALAFPDLGWTVHPVGMVETWAGYDGPEVAGGRAGMPSTCARLSEEHGMPIDEFLWFDDPPESSWPACRAIAAAGLQAEATGGPDLAQRLLRACREATFARRTSVSDPDALADIVRAVPGLDDESLRAAVDDGRADEAFATAREAAASLDLPGVASAGDRPELPALVVRDEGEARGVSGLGEFPTFADVIADVSGVTPATADFGVADLIERLSPEGWVARVELAHLSGQPIAAVESAARELVETGDVVEATFAAEPFWRSAAVSTDPTAAVDGAAETIEP